MLTRWSKDEVVALMAGIRKYHVGVKMRWREILTDPVCGPILAPRRSNWDLRDKFKALVERLAKLFLALSSLPDQGVAFATPPGHPRLGGWDMSDGAEALLRADITSLKWDYIEAVERRIASW